MAQKSKNNNKMNMNMPRPSMLWIYGLIGLFIIGWYLFDGSNEAPLPSDWTTVQEMVEKGDVEKIQVVNRDQAQVFLKKEAGEKYRNDSVDKRFRRLPESGVQLTFTIGSVDSFREDLKAAEEKSGQTVPVIYENKANDWTSILINLLPWVVIIGAWFFIMRSMSRGAGAGGGGGIMNVGKAKAQVFDKDNSKRVTFKDVAGLEEAKVEIMEIVDFLKKADKYKELGAKIPKGALLVGPPGTGKTLLAKAVAGEANVPFLSISGSDFVEMFVGVGASRVRDLFEQAKQKAPCIVFIDEIDAIGRARGKNAGFSGNDERENTLRPCKSHYYSVDLMRDLSDISGELLGHVEKWNDYADAQRQSGDAQVGNTGEQQQPAGHSDSRIKNIADVIEDRPECIGKFVCALRFDKKVLVDTVEIRFAGFLVAEYLNDLLTVHDFLNVPFLFTERLLLTYKMPR